MTNAQLIARLQTLPADAVVLIETDQGLSPLGELTLLPGLHGMPDELLLQADMTPD